MTKYLIDGTIKHRMVTSVDGEISTDIQSVTSKYGKAAAQDSKEKFYHADVGKFAVLPLSPAGDANFTTWEGRVKSYSEKRKAFTHNANDYYMKNELNKAWASIVYGNKYKEGGKPNAGDIDSAKEKTTETIRCVAVDDCQVVKTTKAEDGGNGGNSVYLYCQKNNSIYYYAHMRDNIKQKQGDSVSAGQFLGWMGRTGNAKGNSYPHLHFKASGANYIDGNERNFSNLLLKKDGSPVENNFQISGEGYYGDYFGKMLGEKPHKTSVA